MKLDVNIQKISNEKCIISFSGYLKLDYLKNEVVKLNKLLSEYEVLQISLSNISEMDLAGFQYLKVFRNEAKKRNKKISISTNVKEEIENLFRKAGIEIKEEL